MSPRRPAPRHLWDADDAIGSVSIRRDPGLGRAYVLHARSYRSEADVSLTISDLRNLHTALSALFEPDRRQS